jgi:malonate decarboxylase alpha subunit
MRCRAARKLVVQMVETFREHMAPAFVERLDAWQLAEQAGMAIPPVMIYGDDVTHILTEEGIANLLLCRTEEEREQAIRGVAGYTPVGLGRDKRMVENLRDRGSSSAPKTWASTSVWPPATCWLPRT